MQGVVCRWLFLARATPSSPVGHSFAVGAVLLAAALAIVSTELEILPRLRVMSDGFEPNYRIVWMSDNGTA